MLQKVGDSVRVCQTLSLREKLGQNGDAEKQLFEKLWEWVRKPFQKPLPSQGEPWVELPNTQMVFYFLVQRTPISSKIWQRKVHPASRKSGTKQKSMGPKYSHTYGGHWKKSCRGLCWPSPPHCPPPPSWRPSSSLSAVSWEQTQRVDFSRCTNWEKSCNIWIRHGGDLGNVRKQINFILSRQLLYKLVTQTLGNKMSHSHFLFLPSIFLEFFKWWISFENSFRGKRPLSWEAKLWNCRKQTMKQISQLKWFAWLQDR